MPLHEYFSTLHAHDGFGLVVLEDTSQVVAVIASTNCGGRDVITASEDRRGLCDVY